MSEDQKFMRRCIALAQLGAGTVSPNPMVGAVIVNQGLIIGEGYTSPYGGAHAEVNAINAVKAKYGESEGGRLLATSTVYVSLEPCAHYGKTPPCVDLLIAHQVSKVVIGCKDSFAKVNGLGIEKLKLAGIEVVVGVMEQECLFANRRFFTRIGEHRPYVILKWAETTDGYFTRDYAQQTWISNKASKQLTHKWRSEEDAILVGTRTALVDNPTLNNRLWTGKSPKRILIDRNLSVPLSNNIYSDTGSDLIIFNQEKTVWNGYLKYVALENFDMYLPQNILYQLYLMDVQSVIIEGGVKTIQQFVDAGLWDEARVFVSEAKWGDGVKSPALSVLPKDEIQVASDTLRMYYRK